jgi:hypothetical protein
MLREALKELPDNLSDMYGRIVDQIPPRYRKTAIRLLQFLALSERPLRLDEAIDAIAVAIEPTPRFDPQDRMGDLGDIRRTCSCLITLQDEYAAERSTGEGSLEDG